MATNSQNLSRSSPPGNPIARFFKQLWYFIFCGSHVALIDMVKDMFIKIPDMDFESMEKRTNEVVVMTGGTRGIGFDIVKKLLQLDFTVILGVRNIAASQTKIEEIRKLGISSGQVKLLDLDLKSLQSVRQFADNVLSSTEGKRIDIILNNAGIMNVPYEKTVDNFESHFQVNYLGHFLLTNLLLPRMKDTAAKKNGPCQIMNTSSHAQKGGNLNFDELETSKVYSALKCYFDSKLCQVVHAKTLEKQFQDEGLNIHAYVVHPGEIPTDLWMDLGFMIKFLRPVVKYICRTTDEAANVVLHPLLTKEVAEKQGGQYFVSGKVAPVNRQAIDKEIQRRLWERSMQLTETAVN